ncbi:MAG: 2,3-bisphosphoglycerate-independent phosphoglycerate mutase [Bacteriovoracaceae bacterium]
MTIKNISQKVMLIILDGFGINPNTNKNAIRDANKPYIDSLFQNYPFTTIQAGGELVGLPKGVAGNSEVGHLNLGAGNAVRQDLVRINEAVAKKTLHSMDKLNELISFAQKNTKRIHLMGLLSDGNVHAHIKHIKEIISILSEYKDLEIYLHAFMDGRDTNKTFGKKFVQEICAVKGFYFASMQGRSIGMDRDRRWEKIEHCYKTMTGQEAITKLSPSDYIEAEYQKGIFDEFITPTLFDSRSAIQNNDAVFFMNFRPDRARQLTLAMMDPTFKEFKINVKPGYFLCMSPYVPDEVTLPILFDKEKIPGTLAQYLSQLGIGQLKIAETEKYAHVTYFFNGGEEKPFPKEKRILVPSPKEVATYDLLPEMSAFKVTEELMKELDDQEIRVYICNYANSDMVGHTGNYLAAIKAIEALDTCLKLVVEKAQALNVTVIVTADHGNSDQMVYEDGSTHTSHSDAPVPFCVIHPSLKNSDLKPFEGDFALRDVAPTLLTILGLPIPSNMKGTSIYG